MKPYQTKFLAFFGSIWGETGEPEPRVLAGILHCVPFLDIPVLSRQRVRSPFNLRASRSDDVIRLTSRRLDHLAYRAIARVGHWSGRETVRSQRARLGIRQVR